MKKHYFLVCLLLTTIFGFSQNKAINFDGSNDYVNFGNTAGNNLRTIEFWFQPASDITPNLSQYKTMLGRNTGPLGAGDHYEFGIYFTNQFPNKGKISFTINDNISNSFIIYSNSNNWSANKWYHIAIVFDQIQGTRMFIDGIVQNQTTNYFNDTDTSSFYTAIGRFGDFNARYFEGKIDEVKFHSTAVYSSNFTPNCPNTGIVADRGHWMFESTSSTIAMDSSPMGVNGTLTNGSYKTNDSFCTSTVGINSIEKNSKYDISFYPNPFIDQIKLTSEVVSPNTTLRILDLSGRILFNQSITKKETLLDLKEFGKGIYFYQISRKDNFQQSGKLIKR